MNGTPLTEVPSLDSLMADPAKAATLAPEAAQALLIGLLSLQVILFQRSLVGSGPQIVGSPEKFLTVEEAVAQFGVSAQWLYRHKRRLPPLPALAEGALVS